MRSRLMPSRAQISKARRKRRGSSTAPALKPNASCGCGGAAISGGSFEQRRGEARHPDPRRGKRTAKRVELGVLEIDEVAPADRAQIEMREAMRASKADRRVDVGRDLIGDNGKQRGHAGLISNGRAPCDSAPGAAQAARILSKNPSTSPRSFSACLPSSFAEASTCEAAAPVSLAARLTPAMFCETSPVPRAASWVWRVISRVVAPCCSIAEAIDAEILLISEMTPPIDLIASTASLVDA